MSFSLIKQMKRIKITNSKSEWLVQDNLSCQVLSIYKNSDRKLIFESAAVLQDFICSGVTRFYPVAAQKHEFHWLRKLKYLVVHVCRNNLTYFSMLARCKTLEVYYRIKPLHMFLEWYTTKYTPPRVCIPLAQGFMDTNPRRGVFCCTPRQKRV